jgi:hypothetical protein
VTAHGDLAHDGAREAFFAGGGFDCDLVAGEAREATGGPRPRSVLDSDPVVEVDPKREVVEGSLELGRSARWQLGPRRTARGGTGMVYAW